MFKTMEDGLVVYKVALLEHNELAAELKRRYGDGNCLGYGQTDYDKLMKGEMMLDGMAVVLGLTEDERLAILEEVTADIRAVAMIERRCNELHLHLMAVDGRDGAAMDEMERLQSLCSHPRNRQGGGTDGSGNRYANCGVCRKNLR